VKTRPFYCDFGGSGLRSQRRLFSLRSTSCPDHLAVANMMKLAAISVALQRNLRKSYEGSVWEHPCRGQSLGCVRTGRFLRHQF